MKVFENWVLNSIFGCEMDMVTEELRRLHNKELNDLYSTNTIPVIESRRMRWVENIACMGERRGTNRALVGKPE
jgi:hypothetical protein